MTTFDNDVESDIVVAEIVSEETLEAQVAAMRIEVAALTEIVTHQVTLLGEIKDAINPMLDKLSGNPMFRMLFPGE